jgi:tetratricopeptide (TPR) repeat protein
MRFCAYCGAPAVPGGQFCVECGRDLAPKASSGRIAGLRLTAAFVVVFIGILIAGLIIVSFIVPKPQIGREASNTSKSAGAESQASQTQANLPPGHPQVELPAEARSFIDQVESDAHAKPDDIAAWNRFGEVTMRAAMIDPSYYGKAQQAFGHVLKLQPDNPDALRGIGNLNYDHKNYDEAIAAYEHYLKLRPEDPEVRTDLGTMYLYTGNPDQAVVQYKRAVKLKPDFFEGYYNLGIAYGAQNDAANARKAFDRSLALAPDDASRNKVKEMLAKLPAGGQTTASSTSPPPTAPPASASVAGGATVSDDNKKASPPAESESKQEASASAPQSAGSETFHDAIEEMVRGLPVAGDKVQSVKWNGKLKATVLMDNFPMDQMPPFAKQKFLDDLRDGIRNAKAAHKISDKVEIDLADGATGRVMESVSQ